MKKTRYLTVLLLALLLTGGPAAAQTAAKNNKQMNKPNDSPDAAASALAANMRPANTIEDYRQSSNQSKNIFTAATANSRATRHAPPKR